MKFYTGDENGLIKAISIPNIRKKLKIVQPTVEVWGKVDKAQSIQLLQISRLEGQRVIVAARANGRLTVHSGEDGTLVEDLFPYSSRTVNFVGMHANKDRYVTCNTTGELIVLESNSKKTHSFQLPSDLCRLRVHPTLNNIFAFGGRERDLEVHDLSIHLLDASCKTSIGNLTDSHLRSQKKRVPTAQLFAAKNVKNDFLDLRVPVHITDLQFLEPHGSWEKVVTGTRYHQIRIYDAKSGRRRPVHDWEFGQDPIVSITVGGQRDPHSIYVSNTTATLAAVDIRTGKVIRHYKGGIPKTGEATEEPKPATKKRGLTEGGGPTGAVLGTTILGGDDKSPPDSNVLLGTVGLDRYLRIYQATDAAQNPDTRHSAIAKATSHDGKLLHRIYLKGRLNAVCSEWDEEDLKEDESDEESEEDEEIWSAMQAIRDGEDDITSASPKIRKKRKS